MSETQVWLVERDYDRKGLVRLVYATPDGERHHTRELSGRMLRETTVTAATTVAADRLEPVADDATRERYAGEATRVMDRNDPDDTL